MKQQEQTADTFKLSLHHFLIVRKKLLHPLIGCIQNVRLYSNLTKRHLCGLVTKNSLQFHQIGYTYFLHKQKNKYVLFCLYFFYKYYCVTTRILCITYSRSCSKWLCRQMYAGLIILHNILSLLLRKCVSDCWVYELFMLITAVSTELAEAWLRCNFEQCLPLTEESLRTRSLGPLPSFTLNLNQNLTNWKSAEDHTMYFPCGVQILETEVLVTIKI